VGGARAEQTIERLAYYRHVASRMMPFLRDHSVVVHREDTGGLSTPALEDPVFIAGEDDLLILVEQGAAGFQMGLRARTGEVWFALAVTAPELPFDAVRLTALKLLLVLDDLDIAYLVLLDGDRSLIAVWTWGAADPDELPGGLWGFERTVAARLRDRLEDRFAGTRERDRIGRWIGYDGPVTRMGDAFNAGGQIVTLDTGLLAPTGLMRVPYSLHEGTGLAAIPLTHSDLYTLRPEEAATAGRARRLRRTFEVPINFPRETGRILEV